LRALGRPDAAVVALEQAVARDPGHARAWLALGNAEADRDRLEAAIGHLRHAATLDPALPEASTSLGFALTQAGRLTEAIAACNAAIAIDPAFAPAWWNRAVARLLGGDFAGGFADAEWRKRHPRFAADFAGLRGEEWRGGRLEGKTLLVHAGQGLGDTVQFARYLPLLGAHGARVVLACAPPLVPLLGRLPGVTAVSHGDGLPPYDLWVDQMSLPLHLGTRPDTIPSPDGYLAADPDRVAAWRRGAGAAIRVGLVWAGNPAHPNDARRSLPPNAAAVLRPLRMAARAVPRLRFVALQVGRRHGELADAFGMPDHSAALVDFAETAALVATLDLVIAVDTATAHLAGALGKPVWLMLPHAPDWRWMTGRGDSPWYAAMRLFRQDRPGDWASVVARVAAALRGRYVARPSHHCTASIPSVALTPVSAVPQTRSTSVTNSDQPRRVARLVMS